MKNNLVRQVREALGVSQTDLADRMGTSSSVLSRLESGTHEFTPATLDRIAQALSVHWSQLVPPEVVREIMEQATRRLEPALRRARHDGLSLDDIQRLASRAS